MSKVSRVRIALIAVAAAVSGCISSATMTFTAVSVHEPPPDIRIVKEGVVGEDCPKGAGSYGSYDEATHKAITAAPPANVLINARLSRVERPVAKICVIVTGDAAQL